MTDGIGTTQYTYIPVGQIGANKLFTIDGPWVNDTHTYGYDELGRVLSQSAAVPKT